MKIDYAYYTFFVKFLALESILRWRKLRRICRGRHGGHRLNSCLSHGKDIHEDLVADVLGVDCLCPAPAAHPTSLLLGVPCLTSTYTAGSSRLNIVFWFLSNVFIADIYESHFAFHKYFILSELL